MPSSYYTRETLRFLSELETHNKREWFLANKERYEEHVKEPSLRLIADTAAKLDMDGKLMRVNRDVRFSKDKSPYKANIGIGFHARGLPKAPLLGGLYLHISPTENFIASGAWQPDAPVLGKIRDAIVARPGAWKTARKVGLDEDESALKRAPKGFDPDHALIDDLRRKNFTASIGLSPKEACADDLPRKLLSAEKKLRPLNDFLVAALK